MAEDSQKTSPTVRAVDLFCGVGGLSLGLLKSGISVAVGIDNDAYCKEPYEKNIRTKFWLRDVRDIGGSELLPVFGDHDFKLIAACAPCQPFSGYSLGRSRRSKDWGLLLEVHRLVSELLPDFVTVENVPRLSKEPIWSLFTEGLEALGYRCEWAIVDASRYGVPQSRQRLVLMGSRHGELKLPVPTHTEPVTVREAIGNLPSLAAGETSQSDPMHSARSLSKRNLQRIRASKPGENWRTWPKRLRADCHKRSTGVTFPSVYGRMQWNEPAPTITTQFFGYGNGRFGHPEQDRAISIREGALLQSFPDEFVFADQVNGRVKQLGKLIGNAVPPQLAEHIGVAIVDHAASLFLPSVSRKRESSR